MSCEEAESKCKESKKCSTRLNNSVDRCGLENKSKCAKGVRCKQTVITFKKTKEAEPLLSCSCPPGKAACEKIKKLAAKIASCA